MTNALLASLQPAIFEESETESPLLDFREIYDTYFPFAWRTARRLGVRPSALDDVTQEVFLVVHRKLDLLADHGTLRCWLYAVVVRVVRQHRRTLHRKSPHERAEAVDPSELEMADSHRPDEIAMTNQAKRTVEDILERFDEDRRIVFVLHELEGLTAAEIAEITGANVNTVYSRLRLARAEFEERIAKIGGAR